MLTAAEINSGLSNFYGTESYHVLSPIHRMVRLVATDGVAWLCENAECYWLLDIIASYQPKCQKDRMLRDMQFWTLTVKEGKGVVVCERDEGDVAFTQEIEHTDFPLDEIKIWVETGGEYMVAMLPGER